MKLAVVFPGQGSEKVGMANAWLEYNPRLRQLYDLADRVTGLPILQACTDGPEATLTATPVAQPAIVVNCLAMYEAVREFLPEPTCFAGSSVGECTALAGAGAFPGGYEQTIAVIAERAAASERASAKGYGLAAVIGMHIEEVCALCCRHALEIAAYNSPKQIVVAGSRKRFLTLREEAMNRGAKEVLTLGALGPFHTKRMLPAAMEFQDWCIEQKVQIIPKGIPVISGCNGRPYEAGQDALEIFSKEIASPVQWVRVMDWMISAGITHVLELGAKPIMVRLVRECAPGISVRWLGSPDHIDEIRDWLAA